MENQNNQNSNKISGAVFVGCMFLGIGIGMIYDKVSIGTLIGMGVGFIASAAVKAKNQ